MKKGKRGNGMKRLNLVFVMMMVLAFASTAFAADPEPKAFDAVWLELGNYLGVLAAGLLFQLVSKGLQYLEQKGLISEQRKAQLEDRARVEADKVINYVEALALREGRELDGEAKLAKAIERLVKKFKLDPEEAEELVENALIEKKLVDEQLKKQ